MVFRVWSIRNTQYAIHNTRYETCPECNRRIRAMNYAIRFTACPACPERSRGEHSRRASRNCPLHLSRTLYKSALFMQNKANLLDAQMSVSPVITKEYENKSNWKLGENKANTKPIKPNFRKAKMNVNSILTKDYENVPLRRRAEFKPNQSQS